MPAEQRRDFLVGYGSTLRNVGRLERSAEVLRAALREFPDFAPLFAFLALTLHDAGRHREALAACLTAVVQAEATGLGGYDRALRSYRDLLAEPGPRP